MKTTLPLIPFVPSLDERTETMFKFITVKPGQKTLDLGAGDGRIVIAMAKKGAEAYGIEIRQKYARKAKANIALENLSHTAFIKEGDFWVEDLSVYDIITIYGMQVIMNDLERKLTNELRPGAIVISNGFPIPTWDIWKEEDYVYAYIIAP